MTAPADRAVGTEVAVRCHNDSPIGTPVLHELTQGPGRLMGYIRHVAFYHDEDEFAALDPWGVGFVENPAQLGRVSLFEGFIQ